MRVACSCFVVVVVCVAAACEGVLPPDLGGAFGPKDFVSDADFVDLRVEVDAVEGKDGAPGVYDRLQTQLDGLKEEGALEKDVVVFEDDDTGVAALGDEDTVHTFAELAAAHGDLIDVDAEDGEALMHLLWVDGRYEDDDGDSLILGFAYGGDRIIMLQDNIQRACRDSIVPGIEEALCERTTTTVLLHEMGHLFGLVNNGAEMQRDHQDEAHGNHDDDEDCIMFFSAETSTVSDLIADRIGAGGDDDFAFDDDCLDDLRALAGED